MNEFGRIFRVTMFGESHGDGVGVCVDGCPPGIELSQTDFTADLERRAPRGREGSARREVAPVEIRSGVYRGHTTGAPIMIFMPNDDVDSSAYSFEKIPRPGHADFTQSIKSGGWADLRGGGVSSGRLTAALVAAGVIAKKVIAPISVSARLVSVHGSDNINSEAKAAAEAGDSVGGVVECRAVGTPVGFGEPFFDGIESVISHLVFSIPGAKGIEFGSGFDSANRYGSEENDAFIDASGKTSTNNAGGINGGITNGNEIVFRVAFKPTPSISKPQTTFNFETGQIEELVIKGRHDACFALRAPPVLEAVTAIALADFKRIAK
ncbi:MAG: chorismate synthase [Chloroflexota bacterium]